MGLYSDYINLNMSFDQLTAERKKQLQRIAGLRERALVVYAADLSKNGPTAIDFSDLLPMGDQLANLTGASVDLILETPGGSGEVAEDIIRLLRSKFSDVAIIVPGWAKSSGTIMAMAADAILMEPSSALGPIDAQLRWQGKVFSADALLEGMEKIKDEVNTTGVLNRAYIPILQGISPGELQAAQNALDFAKTLVARWLKEHKFKDWTTRRSTGEVVTDAMREERANEIAVQLCDHKHWLTHGRSIKLAELRAMKLDIDDYSKRPDLADAIRRYYTLLQMTFSQTSMYKLFETPDPKSQIYRFLVTGAPAPQPAPPGGISGDVAVVAVKCQKCGEAFKVQANLDKVQPLQEGHLAFPPDGRVGCPGCGLHTDLSAIRTQLEAQTKKRVITA